ncbi:hypothetical protein GT347_27030 [Xylophilus rhododendri]|uniref:Peptidase M4 n=1 Tax=Xylophilus rhododendri TaxID=2697032 RepID=A0A857JDX4_9BURK|nr:hypothetical protein [Xylophilus rhododendri]QHJ01320.1 hypothetical protein GT347_27030 [Xylophilus rhododendri]
MTRASTPQASAASAQTRIDQTQDRPEHKRRGRAVRGQDFAIGPRVLQGSRQRAYERGQDDPVYRPLRIYALDPSASVSDGAQAIVNVPYEPLKLTPSGLRGAILEVVDAPAADPVHLDDPFVLMRQGHMPSPEDAGFRQQMTYAVGSTTYAAFRQALGREVAWGFRRDDGETGSRLRLRPCVEHLQNAFYDPGRGEICFGAFEAGASVCGRNVPGGMVSLSLAHDVVVHEMSHALLDGLRSHFLHPSNLDVLAFHEGFADLIAVFQRFTYRDVVSRAVRASRGEISASELITDIAVQFAQALDATGALRSAAPKEERRYEDTIEPHFRGEILVAAVFDAFNRVYQRKTAALFRLASDGTGLLPPGEISELLANQLAERASVLASQFLSICIRAIDFCPPVDITFGEFLRAVITADMDLVPSDDWGYREAWIDAFAKRRIYPAGVKSLSESSLIWRAPASALPPEPELSFSSLRFDGDPGRVASPEEMLRQATAFGQLAADKAYLREFGLCPPGDAALGEDTVDLPVVESVRASRRVGPSGQVVFDLIAEITQRRVVKKSGKGPGFDFFGGATVVLDPRGRVRYAVGKSVLDETRLEAQRRFIQNEGQAFFGIAPHDSLWPAEKLLLRLHQVTRPQLRASVGTRAMVRGLESTEAGRSAVRYLARRGQTQPWVSLLKHCLNLDRNLALMPALDDSSDYDMAVEQAVSRLQMASKASVDGIAGPATWGIVGTRLRGQKDTALPDAAADTPRWIGGLLKNDPVTTRLGGLDIEAVIDMTEFSFGPLGSAQRTGLAYLLDRLRSDRDITDLRWAAYMLATVKHECGNTWRPIEEYGKGAGKAYGQAVTVRDGSGNPLRNVYFGRGYVQLTWQQNYAAIGMALGLGRELEIHPEKVLDPGIAYDVMSYGMRHGTFTGKRLQSYFSASLADYLNARRIINGTDCAESIAGYANRFQTMLQACA